MQIRFFSVFCLGIAAHALGTKAAAEITIEAGGAYLVFSVLSGVLAATIAKTA